MFRKRLYASLLVLSNVSLAVASDQTYVDVERRLTPDQMHETGLDSLSSAQLARLNQLLGEQAIVQLKTEQPPMQGAPSERNFIGLGDAPIKSQLVGTISGWDVDTVFELANGQKWKVLKGNMKLRKPMVSPEIIVVPGIAGRWFLQVDEDLPKARVYRID
jgi:hypothetical protein